METVMHMRQRRGHPHALLIVRSLLVTLILVGLLAQPLTTVLAGTPTPNEVEAVARTLYCPLCVGQRLDSCEIPLCQDMKREIAQMLAEGRTPEEIRAYFVEQYGPVVLGEPPRKGINWLAWVIPIIALIGAAVYVFLRIREWSKPPATAAVTPSAPPTPEEDEYAARVERELSQWE